MVKRFVLSLAAAAAPALAGGWFVLSLGQPSVHADPRAQSSSFVVRVSGCAVHGAQLEVTAEGLVNGQRRSIAVQPIALNAGGPDQTPFTAADYAIPKTWPDEGVWVVRVVASTGWLSKSALVAVDDRGVDRGRTLLRDTFSTNDVEFALKPTSTARASE